MSLPAEGTGGQDKRLLFEMRYRRIDYYAIGTRTQTLPSADQL